MRDRGVSPEFMVGTDDDELPARPDLHARFRLPTSAAPHDPNGNLGGVGSGSARPVPCERSRTNVVRDGAGCRSGRLPVRPRDLHRNRAHSAHLASAPLPAMTRAQAGAAGTIASLIASGAELASGLATDHSVGGRCEPRSADRACPTRPWSPIRSPSRGAAGDRIRDCDRPPLGG
jgi:hypothetical protein